MGNVIEVYQLGLRDYQQTWQQMIDYTQQRTDDSKDQLWIVEHYPVFTLGRNGKKEHILNAHHIPVVHSDRGGQVTYHAPGQLIIYCLIDIKRRHLGIRALVNYLENSVIEWLAMQNIKAVSDKKAPGVYVEGSKIAALGLKVSKGCTYHGLSFNLNMDMKPFSDINPCGYSGLTVTQCIDLNIKYDMQQVSYEVSTLLLNYLNN